MSREGIRGRQARLLFGDLVDEGVHGAHGHGTRGHGTRSRRPGLVTLRLSAAPRQHGLPAQALRESEVGRHIQSTVSDRRAHAC